MELMQKPEHSEDANKPEGKEAEKTSQEELQVAPSEQIPPEGGMESEEGEVSLASPPGRRRRRKKVNTLTEEDVKRLSKSSYWPFLLALAVVIALSGLFTHPIVLGVGVVLCIVAAIGWGVER